jgi:hypothetical protein
MAGNDPPGELSARASSWFPLSTAPQLQFRMDLPMDANDNGTMWDVIDGNADNDADDDDENENGDGFINDEGEDLTFTLDAGAGTITMTDNTTGDSFVLADRVLPNPGGEPLFAYVRNPVNNDPILVTLTVTVAGPRDDLITNNQVLYTLTTSIAPRLESVPDGGFVEAYTETTKAKVKKIK